MVRDEREEKHHNDDCITNTIGVEQFWQLTSTKACVETSFETGAGEAEFPEERGGNGRECYGESDIHGASLFRC
jgi:hypothetical protein